MKYSKRIYLAVLTLNLTHLLTHASNVFLFCFFNG